MKGSKEGLCFSCPLREIGIFPKAELECSRKVVMAISIILHICLVFYNCIELVSGTPFRV